MIYMFIKESLKLRCCNENSHLFQLLEPELVENDFLFSLGVSDFTIAHRWRVLSQIAFFSLV